MARISYESLKRRLKKPKPEFLEKIAYDMIILSNALTTASEMARLEIDHAKIQVYIRQELDYLLNKYE